MVDAARAVIETALTHATLMIEQSLRTSSKQSAAWKDWAIVMLHVTQFWVQEADEDVEENGGAERGGGKGGGGGAGGQLGGRAAV